MNTTTLEKTPCHQCAARHGCLLSQPPRHLGPLPDVSRAELTRAVMAIYGLPLVALCAGAVLAQDLLPAMQLGVIAGSVLGACLLLRGLVLGGWVKFRFQHPG